MAIEKYRVRDVARDFGFTAKVITDILGKYGEAPKSNMQALEDKELSVIFEHLTQNNQISSIAAIYADEPKQPESAPAPKAEAAPKAEPAHKAEAAPAKPAQAAQAKPAVSQQAQKPAAQQQTQKPAQPVVQQPQQKHSKSTATAQPTTRVPEKKLVDTRKGGDVNLAKYDQRLEDLGGQRGERMAQKKSSATTADVRAVRCFPTSGGRMRRRKCASSSLRSPRKLPSRSRFPMRSVWVSWPAA